MMKKVEMIEEINEIMGYEFIPAWTSYTYKEITILWRNLKSGKYTLEQRGYEVILVRKEKQNG